MSISSSAGEILDLRVVLELECVDRLYLNVYQPHLQREIDVFRFLRYQRGKGAVSSCHFQTMTQTFVRKIEAYATTNGIPLETFTKGDRKEAVVLEHRPDTFSEGIFFIGKNQEKTSTFRTEGRKNARTGQTYPWIVPARSMVNQYYFYGLDDDFGPFFLKFSSYIPYTARLCINGHEFVKRQLTKAGISFEALDNGLLSCADPKRAQAFARQLTPARIDALLRKWLRQLPHPFLPADRQAGYRYEVSILQAEFALTQVFDRPDSGRRFFEDVIREHLDLGRPSQVQLLFDRRITKRTPGRFRTRVITSGVIPSLSVDYKSSHLKQYFKQGRALRTETVVNDPRDFGIGKRLVNLLPLRDLAYKANRRLLDVQRSTRHNAVGETVFRNVTTPRHVGTQRASALPYGEPLVLALFQFLLMFRHLAEGFRSRELRAELPRLLGQSPGTCTPGQTTYHLRRLRLHGLIERVPKSHRYRVTDTGLRTALFFTRSYARLVRPGMTELFTQPDASISQAIDRFDKALLDLYAPQSKT